MNKEEVFALWAPEDSPWSRWAKPVLFTCLFPEVAQFPLTELTPNTDWAPPPEQRTTLVLDLPGAMGVLAGVALAGRGYRPVPLYNALPLPFGQPERDLLTGRPLAAINVLPIIVALHKGAEALGQAGLPADAPPAFLLDANRAGDGRKMEPDEFDNRSVSFTTDFPSANFFAAQGIERVLLVQKGEPEPRQDLAHSLRRWQDAGFVLERKQIDSAEPAQRFEVARPSWYGWMFQRLLAGFGLRRASGGGFGAWVPESGAGG